MGGVTRAKARKPSRAFPADMKDPHILYAAAVQGPDADLRFVERIFRGRRGHLPVRLREDFCGTAFLASRWVGRRPENEAWGVDLDQPTLDWGREHYIARLAADAAQRVHLLRDDVLHAQTPPADAVIALNFSYFIFKTRALLGAYFRAAHQALVADGVFFMDIYGGTTCPTACRESRRVSGGRTPDGRRIPAFRMTWEHEAFNAYDHGLRCHIHFTLPDGEDFDREFSYDWRLWSVPEVRELLAEAGFASSEVYAHGWTPEGVSDHVFRKRTRIMNEAGWLGYIVAFK